MLVGGLGVTGHDAANGITLYYDLLYRNVVSHRIVMIDISSHCISCSHVRENQQDHERRFVNGSVNAQVCL